MEIFDLVGVGFGPSNLALAVAVDEYNNNDGFQLSMAFFESSSEFMWHKDMLIPNATVQISFIKDLVTLNNPTSEYSFLNYLKSKNRLAKFTNLKAFYPTRMEFYDYFKWSAEKLPNVVRYGKKVTHIKPFHFNKMDLWEVFYEDIATGKSYSVFCKNISVATGGVPKIPESVSLQEGKIWHSSNFLSNIKKFDKDKVYDFCVCGGGQSAAEIVDYIYCNFPKARVHSIFSSFGFKPADDSGFVNEIFDIDNVDMFYESNQERRNKLLAEHSNTNYKVVDIDLIDKLYQARYQELISGSQRLFLNKMSTVKSACVENNKVEVSVFNVGSETVKCSSFDALVVATGYSRDVPSVILESLQDSLVYRGGELSVDRYFRLETKENANIILQGFSETIHGISNTLLSTLSIRSHEILENVLLSNASSQCNDNYSPSDMDRENEVVRVV